MSKNDAVNIENIQKLSVEILDVFKHHKEVAAGDVIATLVTVIGFVSRRVGHDRPDLQALMLRLALEGLKAVIKNDVGNEPQDLDIDSIDFPVGEA